MKKTIDFKVSVSFICKDVIDAESFKNEFNNDPFLCYKDLSDNFKESVLNFCDDEKFESISILNESTESTENR